MTDLPPEPPAFAAPWHAQLFAVTVHLHARGLFTWPEWTQALGAILSRHGAGRALDGGDDYFAAWLEALEGLLAARSLADPAEVSALRDAWEAAYLSTPHGAPVHLHD